MGQGPSEKLQQVKDIRTLTIWDCFFLMKMMEPYMNFNPTDYQVVEIEGENDEILFNYTVEEQIQLFERFSEIVEVLSIDDFKRGPARQKLLEEKVNQRNRMSSPGWAKRELEQEKLMKEKQQDGNE
jgi:hypothetical protein